MPDSQDSLSGLGQRSSLYAKSTNPGDTAVLASPAGRILIAGSLAIGDGATVVGLANAVDSTSNAFCVAGFGFNGAFWDRLRTPNKFNHALATAAGNTAVWTPAAGKKFRLMRFAVG